VIPGGGARVRVAAGKFLRGGPILSQPITNLFRKGRTLMSNFAISIATALLAGATMSPAFAAEGKMQMDHGAMMTSMDHCGLPMGEGVINTLDVKKSKINVTHKPIESIGWPEMKMDFAVLKPIDLAAFATGERVHFLLKAEKDKSYSIAAMCSLDVEEGAHNACMTHMHDVAMKAAADDGRSCDMEGMGDMPGMDHSAHEQREDAHKGHH
jgi:Cu/Ag efflux protein CusF